MSAARPKRGPKSIPLRQRLLAGETLLGGWAQIAATASAELLAEAGFDWVALDCEHGLIDIPTAAAMLAALDAHDVPGLVRLPDCDSIWIRRALDAGAEGLIVPMVNSAEIAAEAVRWARYPPEGERGFGFSRANGYGASFDEYCARANDRTIVVAQIEHALGVRDIEAILQVKGVDAVFIGPYDLAGSMGLVGQTGHPDVIRACQQVLAACRRMRVPAGIHVVSANPADARSYLARGFTFVALGLDTLFIRQSAHVLLGGARRRHSRPSQNRIGLFSRK